jgi:hypothetical protein
MQFANKCVLSFRSARPLARTLSRCRALDIDTVCSNKAVISPLSVKMASSVAHDNTAIVAASGAQRVVFKRPDSTEVVCFAYGDSSKPAIITIQGTSFFLCFLNPVARGRPLRRTKVLLVHFATGTPLRLTEVLLRCAHIDRRYRTMFYPRPLSCRIAGCVPVQ